MMMISIIKNIKSREHTKNALLILKKNKRINLTSNEKGCKNNFEKKSDN